MKFEIGSEVIYSAVKGKVLAAEVGRRGREIYTVALDDGRTIRADGWSLEGRIEFAPASWDFSGLPRTSEATLRAKINRHG